MDSSSLIKDVYLEIDPDKLFSNAKAILLANDCIFIKKYVESINLLLKKYGGRIILKEGAVDENNC